MVPPGNGDFTVYLTLTLEKPIQSQMDQIVYVTLQWVVFEPLPPDVKRFAMALVADSKDQRPEIPYVKLDLSANNQIEIERVLAHYHSVVQYFFLSTWMRVSPDMMDNNFNALYYFVIPRNLLDRNLTLFMMVKDEQERAKSNMPSTTVALTTKTKDNKFRLNELLNSILYETGHEAQGMEMQIVDGKGTKAIGGSRTSIMVEVACKPYDLRVDPSIPHLDTGAATKNKSLNELMDQGPENLDDREKWHLLTRELIQKQEICHRLMRENDDKSQSLKLATAEIVDLRRTLKMMQSETQILRQKLGE